MKRRRSFIVASALGLALLCSGGAAQAQTTGENLAKYHRLRERLVTEFTVVGDGPGQSQPADVRDDGEGFIKWADSTIRLGWYLGVLATEHHIFTHPSDFPGAKGSEPTLDELYSALLAMERLDEVADAAFPPPCSSAPSLNGFFIRDDVPDAFHQGFVGLTTTYSDFVDPVLTNKEMSQDQVYHVLIGLALVKRFVPAGVTVKGRELSTWAVEQARRIVEHMSDNGWVITNPACQDREVERGPLASGFSGGSRQAIGFITDGAFVPDTQPALMDVWNKARSPDFAVYLDIDNLHMALSIAAVGNGWADTTAEDLALLGEKPDWPIYALLHRALHGDAAAGWCKTAADVNTRARLMLDELPADGEPASPKPAPLAAHGFTRSNRFMRGKETAYTGEPNSDGYRFNGLDYLLLHNLYAIATPATWQGGSGPDIPACTASSDGGAAAAADDDDGGCGCRAVPRRTAPWPTLLLLVLTSVTLRRGRRRWPRARTEGKRHIAEFARAPALVRASKRS